MTRGQLIEIQTKRVSELLEMEEYLNADECEDKMRIDASLTEVMLIKTTTGNEIERLLRMRQDPVA